MSRLTIVVGVDGEYQLETPRTDADIIQLGVAFRDYEASLPLADRLKEPSPDRLEAALSTARSGLELAGVEEIKRGESANAVHRAMAEATPLLKEGIRQLKWKYHDNLPSLERWGLSTQLGANGAVLVTSPRTEKQWGNFLVSYAQREQELPTAEQLAVPDLARLMELAAIVEKNRVERDTSTHQRKLGVETRSATARPLLDLLQLACGLLVVTRFDGRVTNALAAWGFTVKGVNSAPPAPAPEPPAA
jgi:hypothetical protein